TRHLYVGLDVLQYDGRGVIVAHVATQLELGQLRPDVLQGAPRLPRRPDLGVVVRGPCPQARKRERGGRIARAAGSELAVDVISIYRVHVVLTILEPHQRAAYQAAED